MGIYTNEGLVKHVEKALALKTKYMWGGILALVEKYYDLLFKTYGIDAAKGYTAARWNELSALKNKGVYAVDCVGLIKSYYWSGKPDGGTGSPKYGAAGYPDVGAGTMYQRAKVKGKIDTMPETKGIIVISRKHGNHVGVYIGGGYTIESTLGNRGDGVVKHKLDKSFWTDWFECPYISYPTAISKTKTYRLAFPAVVREKALNSSKKLDRLEIDTAVEIVPGTETKDPKTGFTYIKITAPVKGWITKSALG